jgi:hypothetical protein
MKKTITAAALTFCMAAIPAMAIQNQGKAKGHAKKTTTTRSTMTQPMRFDELFSRYDSNRDGWISRSEFPSDRSNFDLVDVNRDGRLTRTEAQQALGRGGAVDQQFRQLDVNRDGAVSRTEWRGDYTTFQRLDRNRDGVLSQADRYGTAVTNDARRYQGLDRNRDGMVTRSEWRGNDQSFRMHDRNNDGVLSGSEMR